MFNIGFSELFVFGIIALLVLGPEKLPEAARFAGKWYARLIRFINNAQQDLNRELGINELREQMQKEMERITELEQRMQEKISELEQQTQYVDTDKFTVDDAETVGQKSKEKMNLVYLYLTEDERITYVFSPSFLEKKVTNLFIDRQESSSPKNLKVAV
ncbi:Sec-independent protein translocase protein TatB [Acinetobacter baumannii]|uniref:Sec-independent protein translocase protein TatB n=1 Tax=Acinetobacter baumannii TaxID=470 RepID=UPI001C0B6E98|nr:Sec-independent protein translocase protein TatB [Acinetobacter baumannii]MBU3082358.1 Sec-independent protein translocase protein TatB [Acinetobacter baumannii]